MTDDEHLAALVDAAKAAVSSSSSSSSSRNDNDNDIASPQDIRDALQRAQTAGAGDDADAGAQPRRGIGPVVSLRYGYGAPPLLPQ